MKTNTNKTGQLTKAAVPINDPNHNSLEAQMWRALMDHGVKNPSTIPLPVLTPKEGNTAPINDPNHNSSEAKMWRALGEHTVQNPLSIPLTVLIPNNV